MTWTKVLALPSHEGLKPRKPVITFIAPATAMMAMSRPMTAAVTQKGTGKWRPSLNIPGIVSMMNAVVIRQFVGDRVDDRAEFGFLFHATGDKSVNAVRHAGDRENRERPAFAIDKPARSRKPE